MRQITQKARYEFIHLMQQHVKDYPPTVEQFAKRLMRYGATLGRLAEEQCNGYQTYDGRWDEKATGRSERKEARIRERVAALCERFNCTAVFQGDPRGNVLKIQVPDGFTNDWGREGICVPTS